MVSIETLPYLKKQETNKRGRSYEIAVEFTMATKRVELNSFAARVAGALLSAGIPHRLQRRSSTPPESAVDLVLYTRSADSGYLLHDLLCVHAGLRNLDSTHGLPAIGTVLLLLLTK